MAPVMSDIMEKQTEKVQNKIRITENTATLEQLRERIQEEETRGSGEIKQIKEGIQTRMEAIKTENIKKAQGIKDRTKRPEEFESYEAMQPLSKLKRSTNCIQVITPAKSPDGRTCINFPTPCDVPSGWQKVENCVQADKEEDIETLTCTELCLSLGHEMGICRKWAVVPSAKMGCRNNETMVSATSDCFVPTNLMGLGKACCCSNLLILIPNEQGERQIEMPITNSQNKIKSSQGEAPALLNISPSDQSDEEGETPTESTLNTNSTIEKGEKSTKGNR